MRNTNNQPFCWQEKKILRLIRKTYQKNPVKMGRMLLLYYTLTQIDSDFNGKEIKYYTKTIRTYSGLSVDFIPKGLKELEKLQIIEIHEVREQGRFAGKTIKYTPELISNTINGNTITVSTVAEFPGNGESITGKTVTGESDTLEDSINTEDSINKKKYIEIQENEKKEELKRLKKNIKAIFLQKSPEQFKTKKDYQKQGVAIKQFAEDTYERFDNSHERDMWIIKTTNTFFSMCEKNSKHYIRGSPCVPLKMLSEKIWIEVINEMLGNKQDEKKPDYSSYRKD